MPTKRSRNIYQLRVALQECQPAIWRRFEVFDDITLPRLHLVLQIVMGWENYHLHEFTIGGKDYQPPDPEDDHFGRTVLDERRVELRQLMPAEGTSLVYLYDFGDGWRHDVTLESVHPAVPRKLYPVCIGGERSAPPEDVGGPFGYFHYLEALFDLRHPEHREMLAWRGRFDPEYFSPAAVNRAWRAPAPARRVTAQGST